MPKNMIRAIKLVVSASLIAYLIYAVDWAQTVAELSQARPALVVFAVGFFLVNIGTSAWKWQISLQIRAQNADNVLALKGNQSTLHDDVERRFDTGRKTNFHGYAVDTHHTADADHGRMESRRYWTVAAIDWLEGRQAWPGLNSIGIVEWKRAAGDQITTERRYYLQPDK